MKLKRVLINILIVILIMSAFILIGKWAKLDPDSYATGIGISFIFTEFINWYSKKYNA